MPALSRQSPSAQTLRRRLREEGSSYQEIKDNIRRDAAIGYLSRPQLSIMEIAQMMGFSEPSTFHRAFKKWIDAVEVLGIESGLPRAVARLRAEDLVVRIEGALVVCAGTGDTGVFARAVRDLRESVLAPPARVRSTT